MKRSSLQNIGALCLGYGAFIGMWMLNLLLGGLTGRHDPKEPPIRTSQVAYFAVVIAATVALMWTGAIIHKKASTVSAVRSALKSTISVLIVKSIVVAWMIFSYVYHPSGPLDGLVLALIPLSIVPGIIVAFVLLIAWHELGTATNKEATHLQSLNVDVSVPHDLVEQVETLIAHQKAMKPEQ